MSFLFNESILLLVELKMPFCDKCGKELSDDANFCKYCGARTERAIDEPHWQKSIDESISEAVKTIETTVKEATKNVRHGSWSWNPYEVKDERVLTGEVNLEKLFLTVKGRNGGITVSSWDKPEYKAHLYIKVRGKTQEDAENNLKELIIDHKDTDEGDEKQLYLEARHPNLNVPFSVSMDLTLPRNVATRLDIKTSNGRLNLKDLSGSTMHLKTSNGKVNLSNMTAEMLDVKTSNGKVLIYSIKAKDLIVNTSNGLIEGDLTSGNADLRTSNGKIILDVKPVDRGDYLLRTSNGRVVLNILDNPETGYDLDLTTSLGKILLDLPGLDFSRDKKHHKEAVTRGYESKAQKIKLKVVTSNGRIVVNPK